MHTASITSNTVDLFLHASLIKTTFALLADT